MAVVPDRTELLLDRRILPGESIEDVDSEVEELLAAAEDGRDVTTDRTLVQHYASSSIPTDHPLAVRFRERAADRAGVPGEPWGLEAATDAREFVARGCPAIVWGPGSLDQAHTVDEWVALDDARLGLDLLEAGVRGRLAGEDRPA